MALFTSAWRPRVWRNCCSLARALARVSWVIANPTNSALVDPLKFYSTYPTERTRALQLGRQTSECEQELPLLQQLATDMLARGPFC